MRGYRAFLIRASPPPHLLFKINRTKWIYAISDELRGSGQHFVPTRHNYFPLGIAIPILNNEIAF